MDWLGLYRTVLSHGGLSANGRYDGHGRWRGINFAGAQLRHSWTIHAAKSTCRLHCPCSAVHGAQINSVATRVLL
jgi:hypothetical protein